MAKKSFKKGVDSLIQPTGNNESKEETAKKKSPAKPKNEAKKNEKFVIDLGTKLTIDKMPEVKQQLEDAIKDNNLIVLHSKNVEDIDLSFIQMVISTEKTFEIQKKKLELDLKFPDEVAQLLVNSGFGSFLEK